MHFAHCFIGVMKRQKDVFVLHTAVGRENIMYKLTSRGDNNTS